MTIPHAVDSGRRSIFYVSVPVDSADQANCLAEYLTQHGQTAYVEGGDAVVFSVGSGGELDTVAQMCDGWRKYWENYQGELFGLPRYTKPDCDASHG